LETKTNQTPEGETNTTVRFAAVAVLGLVAVVLLFLGARSVARLVAGGDSWDVVAGQPVQVTVEAGSSATSVYRTMHDAGVVRSSDLQAAAKAAGVEDRLQAGTYSLTTDMEPDAVVRRLVEGGDVTSGATFTVIEGWTIDRIIDELADATAYSRAEYRKALREGTVRSPLLPDDASDPVTRWEGLLYPAKYPMSEGATPSQILQMMADEMTRRFEGVDWSRIGELGISRYEALVIGSLIEWEAGTDGDRPIIASVIHNRLDEPMRLQIDATVIYALGYNPGRVLGEHLKIDSPYNTYGIDGLPPTPIGTVSTASLEAAVNPVQSDYLFYVLGHEDGSHVFAATYAEHQANVEAAKEAGILP
jgi:UPF0755 protein